MPKNDNELARIAFEIQGEIYETPARIAGAVEKLLASGDLEEKPVRKYTVYQRIEKSVVETYEHEVEASSEEEAIRKAQNGNDRGALICEDDPCFFCDSGWGLTEDDAERNRIEQESA